MLAADWNLVISHKLLLPKVLFVRCSTQIPLFSDLYLMVRGSEFENWWCFFRVVRCNWRVKRMGGKITKIWYYPHLLPYSNTVRPFIASDQQKNGLSQMLCVSRRISVSAGQGGSAERPGQAWERPQIRQAQGHSDAVVQGETSPSEKGLVLSSSLRDNIPFPRRLTALRNIFCLEVDLEQRQWLFILLPLMPMCPDVVFL